MKFQYYLCIVIVIVIGNDYQQQTEVARKASGKSLRETWCKALISKKKDLVQSIDIKEDLVRAKH